MSQGIPSSTGLPAPVPQELLARWPQTEVSDDTTHHRLDGQPLYAARFDEVLKFHAPGLAPVRVGGSAFHITMQGESAYSQRFLRTFGFYEGRATVKAVDGWHPITPDGEALTPTRYAWCGNFQGGRCPVRDEAGRYHHLTLAGVAAYPQRWRYAGDFRDGIGVVQGDDGRATHIDPTGTPLHGHWFLDLDVFHKGFARARDARGWLHIDRQGKALYSRRFAAVEPFYNGQARVETIDGGLEVIDETGRTQVVLRGPLQSAFEALSADLVGHWKTDTIAAAVRRGLFEALPSDVAKLADHCGLRPDATLRLLRALGELGLVTLTETGVWQTTERGGLLRQAHPLTLADAALEYAGPLRARWQALDTALQQSVSPSVNIFREVAQDATRCRTHHRMLRSYARHDYTPLLPLLPLTGAHTIVDAGGGTGTLTALLATAMPDSRVVLLELPEVVAQARPFLPAGAQALGLDLFEPWPVQAEVIIFARVLHDWDDGDAMRLLIRAREALLPGGRVVLLEMLLEAEGFGGGLCDLHLLAVTGGRERTQDDFARLLASAGLRLEHIRQGPTLPHVLVGLTVEDMAQ